MAKAAEVWSSGNHSSGDRKEVDWETGEASADRVEPDRQRRQPGIAGVESDDEPASLPGSRSVVRSTDAVFGL